MIPHAPPMRFELDGADVVLPAGHPLAPDGAFPALALIELAAQLAGRAAPAAPGHRGMLVEVEGATLLTAAVPAGTRLSPVVTLERSMGPLHRFHVLLPGVLATRLTLRIAE